MTNRTPLLRHTARYFERPYCREEIEIADQLRIEGRLRIFPVARALDGIPERYLRKVQYLDARANAGFVSDLVTQITQDSEAPVTSQSRRTLHAG